MIPLFTIAQIPLGPLRIQVWGLFVAAGILAAVWIGWRASARRGIDPEHFIDLASWSVLSGIVGARLGHVLFYDPARYIADPLAVFRVWEGGMSMFGAFIGAALAMVVYFRKEKIAWAPYLDAMAFAFPCGYGIGRIGCFLIHDHPGTLSNLPIAVDFPGGARLDHGLLLMLVGFGIYAWFVRREYRIQTSVHKLLGDRGFLPLLMMTYGTARFFLDFFRATDLRNADIRYGALTPAQYLSIVMLALGAWLWSRRNASHSASL
jgi:phosphatidylglycerol---prolipoprotein diacylglyceryl transferase